MNCERCDAPGVGTLFKVCDRCQRIELFGVEAVDKMDDALKRLHDWICKVRLDALREGWNAAVATIQDDLIAAGYDPAAVRVAGFWRQPQ